MAVDVSVQEKLDAAIDAVLDALDNAQANGEEVDPLQTIVARMQARGASMDLSEAPPILRMLLGGMLE